MDLEKTIFFHKWSTNYRILHQNVLGIGSKPFICQVKTLLSWQCSVRTPRGSFERGVLFSWKKRRLCEDLSGMCAKDAKLLEQKIYLWKCRNLFLTITDCQKVPLIVKQPTEVTWASKTCYYFLCKKSRFQKMDVRLFNFFVWVPFHSIECDWNSVRLGSIDYAGGPYLLDQQNFFLSSNVGTFSQKTVWCLLKNLSCNHWQTLPLIFASRTLFDIMGV